MEALPLRHLCYSACATSTHRSFECLDAVACSREWTCAPLLLLKMQVVQDRLPVSMVIAPVCRPLLVVKLELVMLKAESKPWMTPSGVPVTREA